MAPQALAGLDRGLLVTTHHRFALRRKLRRLLVEVQDWGRLVEELRVSRVLPGVRAPGFDLVLPQPRADRPRRDALNQLLLDGHLRQFFARPAHPGLARLARGTTGEGDDLCPLQRRKGARATRTRRVLQARCGLPASAPALDRVQAATELSGNLHLAASRDAGVPAAAAVPVGLRRTARCSRH